MISYCLDGTKGPRCSMTNFLFVLKIFSKIIYLMLSPSFQYSAEQAVILNNFNMSFNLVIRSDGVSGIGLFIAIKRLCNF